MDKGFTNASLRVICKNSRVTTGALYKRYKSKDELFEAVVKETTDAINDIFNAPFELPKFEEDNKGKNLTWFNEAKLLDSVMEFIYDNYDGFRLLVCCSEGSRYQDFVHIFVDKSIELMYQYTTLEGVSIEQNINVTKRELHLMLTTYWNAIFEPVVHEFEREDAIRYSKTLGMFFDWNCILR